MITGVVADDVTGSNDIGIMFAGSGCPAYVYSYDGPGSFKHLDLPAGSNDVCILNTNSRLDSPDLAYDKVYEATRVLQQSGCRRFFNKTCSVFRGNIGAEFDAMLDALGLEFAVVVLGFPKNGRTTLDGIHYVRGQRLEDSEFRNDPIHPLQRSDLVGILGSQTKRKVAAVYRDVLAQGPAALRQKVQEMRSQCNYLILDVVDQGSLRTIAQAVYDEPVLCGSSALAEELPAVWGVTPPIAQPLDLPRLDGVGLLCVAGSLMPQTQAQVRCLIEHGALPFELDGLRLFDPVERHSELQRLVDGVSGGLLGSRDVLLHSSHDPQAVSLTRQAGRDHGLPGGETARRVTDALAQVTAAALQRTGQNRLVVAGGETSAAVCAALGLNGLKIWKEIQAGLPSCLSLPTLAHPAPMLLVLKSGSFGTETFLIEAMEHVRSAFA